MEWLSSTIKPPQNFFESEPVSIVSNRHSQVVGETHTHELMMPARSIEESRGTTSSIPVVSSADQILSSHTAVSSPANTEANADRFDEEVAAVEEVAATADEEAVAVSTEVNDNRLDEGVETVHTENNIGGGLSEGFRNNLNVVSSSVLEEENGVNVRANPEGSN
ncbi:hypothetical protein V6N12_020832 [Hibiscus sabdariffa]|uniref:Uncharacterized protein n=1 Tax=Hibiscus sabdariffa TaxID=183260 RepID=A0ABR2CZ88_9ROSI